MESYRESKMKLGIVGSRKRDAQEDYFLLIKRVKELQPDMIISGGCSRGADKFAEQIARRLDILITIHYPKIGEKVKSYNYWKYVDACYARNKLIAEESDKLIALVAVNRKGGTENTIKHFKACHSREEDLEIL